MTNSLKVRVKDMDKPVAYYFNKRLLRVVESIREILLKNGKELSNVVKKDILTVRKSSQEDSSEATVEVNVFTITERYM